MDSWFPAKLRDANNTHGARFVKLNCSRFSGISLSQGSRASSVTFMRIRLFSFATLLLVLVVLAPATARAGEIQVDVGTTMLGSSWQGDFTGGGLVRLGYRFARVVSIDTVVWEQLGNVDSRFLTGLTIGVTGYIPLKRVRPSLRVFAIHQHEEGAVSVAQTPGGFLFGIGSGIRHRGGGGVTLGAEIPFLHRHGLEWVVLAEVEGIYFPDPLGPTFYLGGIVGVGFNYALPKLP